MGNKENGLGTPFVITKDKDFPEKNAANSADKDFPEKIAANSAVNVFGRA